MLRYLYEKNFNATLVPDLDYQKRLERHLYLMHSETRERLDETKKVGDYGLSEGSILRLMSGAR